MSTLYDSSMPFAMFFDGGQAVHYSADFAADGYYGASHGCVNIRDYDEIACAVRRGAAGRQGRRLLVVTPVRPSTPYFTSAIGTTSGGSGSFSDRYWSRMPSM